MDDAMNWSPGLEAQRRIPSALISVAENCPDWKKLPPPHPRGRGKESIFHIHEWLLPKQVEIHRPIASAPLGVSFRDWHSTPDVLGSESASTLKFKTALQALQDFYFASLSVANENITVYKQTIGKKKNLKEHSLYDCRGLQGNCSKFYRGSF